MRNTRKAHTVSDTPSADQKKKASRREALSLFGVMTGAGLCAAKDSVYAKAAVKASLSLEPEPGSPMGGV